MRGGEEGSESWGVVFGCLTHVAMGSHTPVLVRDPPAPRPGDMLPGPAPTPSSCGPRGLGAAEYAHAACSCHSPMSLPPALQAGHSALISAQVEDMVCQCLSLEISYFAPRDVASGE